MASRVKRTKVGRACERCRRQKLKCDIKRPCTLCVRAGVECQAGDRDQFITSDPISDGGRQRPRGSARQRAKRRHGPPHDEQTGEESWSSSTMSLVTGAFQFHNSAPNASMTAFPGGSTSDTLPERRSARSGISIPWMQGSRSVIAELIRLLPTRQVASLLVDTYFDRVHWFILIFHQDDFRRKWQQMYEFSEEALLERYHNPGFISTFLVVIAIGLHYAGSHRQEILQAHGVDHIALKETIFSAIRAKLLDIVSLGSLESVQTCVLLGTYYLYHGNPGLAWPVCGCGLRVAQALNLHRKLPTNSDTKVREAETRKRCWWAIYEIETFCSMSYGYPHGIKDADCDVELLDPLATSSGQSPAIFDETHQCPASLLSYKYLMSKLSVLVKDILTDLYGISHQGNGQKENSGSHNLQNLIRKISKLDNRLREWRKEIPSALRPNTDTTSYSSAEEMDHDIGASGPKFERHIYQLQALSLELTYENARILLHRPLLSYKFVNKPDTQISPSSTPLSSNPIQLSSAACRDAALHTSNLGDSPIFNLAADTYAATFIGIHTFTAGVMLCILTSIEPLSPESHESKMGLSRLMKMQTHLKSRTHSTLAAQGLEIIERLTRLVMEKELKEIINDKHGPEPRAQPRQNQEYESTMQSQNNTTSDPPELQGEGICDVIEDPAMSQALFDFDQVISGSDINIPLEHLFPDIAGPGNGFTQEQAWIWGMDTSQFPGFD